MFYCPNCGNEVIKSYPGGKIKLRTNIVIFQKSGEVFCKCQKCHSDVNIPIILELPTGETVPPSKKLKHIIIQNVLEEKNETGKPKLEKSRKETKLP